MLSADPDRNKIEFCLQSLNYQNFTNELMIIIDYNAFLVHGLYRTAQAESLAVFPSKTTNARGEATGRHVQREPSVQRPIRQTLVVSPVY